MDPNQTKTKTFPAITKILLLLLVVAVATFGIAWIIQAKPPQKASIGSSGVLPEKNHQLTVPIVIDTAGQTMNAAEVQLAFDPKLVEVVRVGKERSLFKIWIEGHPKFSNISGTISFAGGVMSPGFSGKAQIGTVTLRSKQALRTELRFAAGTQILLNDGKGTAVPLELKPIQLDLP